jgi:LysM repeat protein
MAMLMNTSNPFQVPTCFQRADCQQRRRERFRRWVVVAVVGFVALLVVMLIEGCVSEHAKTSSTPVAAVDEQTVAVAPSVPTVEPKPVVPPVPPPVRTVAAPAVVPAAVATKEAVPPAVNRPEIVYVVKAGDTLGRIARQHHTTAKAIKDINGLSNDMIAVGAKLKLPSV